jgi:hypothetical protein
MFLTQKNKIFFFFLVKNKFSILIELHILVTRGGIYKTLFSNFCMYGNGMGKRVRLWQIFQE